MGTNLIRAAALGAIGAGAVLGAAAAAAQPLDVYPYIDVHSYPSSSEVAAAADFDGDGNLDLVLQGPRSVTIAGGDGEGGFMGFKARGPAIADGVAVADFDGDGNPDLATVARVAGRIEVTVSRGAGDGTFRAAASASLPAVANGSRLHGYLADISVADFDGDGDPDIAVRGTESFANLRWSDGALLAPVETQIPAATPSPEGEGEGGLTFYEDGPAATGDFDGDGVADLAVEAQDSSFSGNTIVVLTGRPDGTFGQVLTSPGSGYSTTFTAGDLDGDGHLDLLGSGGNTLVSSANLTVSYGIGDGGFETARRLASPTGQERPSVSDVDHDGDLDITSLDVPGALRVFENLGGRRWRGIAAGTTVSGPRSTFAGDFNGDGWPDLAVSSEHRLAIALDGLSPRVRRQQSRLDLRLGHLSVPQRFDRLGTRSEITGTCSATCSVRLTLSVSAAVQRRAGLDSAVIGSAKTRWAPDEDNSTSVRLRPDAVRSLRRYPGRSFRILVIARATAPVPAPIGHGLRSGSDRSSFALASGGR